MGIFLTVFVGLLVAAQWYCLVRCIVKGLNPFRVWYGYSFWAVIPVWIISAFMLG